MAREITKNIYRCTRCEILGIKKEFDSLEAAENHETYDHDIQYVPIEKADLRAILNFIATNSNNQVLLRKPLLDTLRKYARE